MSIRSLAQVPHNVMEKRHYEQIAALIGMVDEAWECDHRLIEAATRFLAKHNKNFNTDRFTKAATEYAASYAK